MLKDAAFQDFSHFLNDIIAYAKVTINGSTVMANVIIKSSTTSLKPTTITKYT